MKFVQVSTLQEIEKIEALARIIIPEHYLPFLPADHIDFYIETFQTTKAIQEQLSDGMEYYLCYYSQEIVGYIGISQKEDTLILNKLYLLKTIRGKGIGSAAMDLILSKAIEKQATGIQLIVSQANKASIAFYKKHGFEILREVSNKYENGQVEVDFEMVKKLRKKNDE